MKTISKTQAFLISSAMILASLQIATRFSYIDNQIIRKIELVFNKTLRDPARWIDIIQHTLNLAIFTLLNIYFINFIPWGIKIKNEIKDSLGTTKSVVYEKKSSSAFFFSCILLFIVYFNIITSNFYYADDVFRNYGGNRSWIGFSRYISEFLSIFLHNSLKLNDMAPLTQFIAIAFAGATIVLLSISLTGKVGFANVLALSAIFIAPCFAECVSYRFDSPYMTLSLFFAAAPFLFYRCKKAFPYVSIICLTLTCMSYQAALSLYILAAIYLFAKDSLVTGDAKKSLEQPLWALGAFALTLIIFKLFFMNKMQNELDSYFSAQIVPAAFLGNAKAYIRQTFAYHGGIMSKALFVLSIVFLIISFCENSKKNKFLAFAFIVAILIAAYVLSFGPYLALEKPLLTPRALMGFNVFVALILLACVNLNKQKHFKTAMAIAALSAHSFTVFMFTYGNCLKNQKEYENFRIQMIIKDFAECVDKENDKDISVSFIGDIDLSKKSGIALKNYPILKDMIPRLPVEASSWNDELLNGYNLKCKSGRKKLTSDFAVKKSSLYHTIYQNENDIIVELR